VINREITINNRNGGLVLVSVANVQRRKYGTITRIGNQTNRVTGVCSIGFDTSILYASMWTEVDGTWYLLIRANLTKGRGTRSQRDDTKTCWAKKQATSGRTKKWWNTISVGKTKPSAIDESRTGNN